MRIGEAAKKAGLGATAIRFYEKEGVVPMPGRTEAGYRDYTDADVSVLRFVRRARSLEIPLGDVREIVEMRASGQVPCDVVRTVIAREAAAIDARIEELRMLRDELTQLNEIALAVADIQPNANCVCHIIDDDVTEGETSDR
ncbi:Cu(I)-responsive transcriptional regulator [hydrothermal vent metagenome]|uniref:Cu(I)-responsive transcriptional regulator n=1 Tax=hydrothermal vent metagenome TaxID=652676 RepID=A0A3B0SNG1_9ZZZZ